MRCYDDAMNIGGFWVGNRHREVPVLLYYRKCYILKMYLFNICVHNECFVLT